MLANEISSIIGCILLALLGLVTYQLASHKLPLPPGPPRQLIVGNVHQLPKSDPWRTFAKWGKTYGPVIYFRVFYKQYVVLNSAKSAIDLLESRSSIYSDRPNVWMLSKNLLDRDNTIFLMSSHDPRFKQYRKQLHSGLNNRVIQTHIPLINQETQVLLNRLASAPDDFISHIRCNAGAAILKITYGWMVTSNEDPLVSRMEQALRLAEEMVQPGKWLVEIFPLLRFVPAWMPGAGFKRKAIKARHHLAGMEYVPFKWAKEQIKTGDYTESFTSMGLNPDGRGPLNKEEEDNLMWCCDSLFTGGADTTVSAMTTFFLMMLVHPEVQRRAQNEIDRVVGRGRLPNIEDQKALPFTMALIKEVLRFAPVVPMGLPHCVTRTDVYQGFCIPKGTIMIANIWAITHDSDMYPNPWVFDPERFVPRPGVEPQTDPRKWVFGFGRRVCPGAHFAEISMFLNIAAILATLNISKPVTKDGQEVEPDTTPISDGILSHPKPFKCRITQRSADLPAVHS